MYKAKNGLLPQSIRRLFKMQDSHYSLRGTVIFEKPKIRTNVRSPDRFHVNLWSIILKTEKHTNWPGFKKLYKSIGIMQYTVKSWLLRV